MWAMAVLTSAQRDRLPDRAFALPSERKYPYRDLPGGRANNLSHARNALSRAAQNESPATEAEVRRKVHAEYPELRDDQHRSYERVGTTRRGGRTVHVVREA